jgi:hypothetical protein
MLHTAWQQPRVAWGTATSALDLRRLARYIAPFPGTPEVAIYYSKPSLCLDGDYSSTLSQTHAATNFLDAPVGFVTDRMILAGKLSPYRLLIVPAAPYVEPDVRQAIADFARNGGRLLLIGDSLSLSPAGAPYGDAVTGLGLQKIEGPDPALLADAFDKAGISRPVRVSSPARHHVECRSVTVDGKTVIYLLALGKETETIRVAANGKPLGTWTDLVARSQGQGGEFTLAPQEIRLLQLD